MRLNGLKGHQTQSAGSSRLEGLPATSANNGLTDFPGIGPDRGVYDRVTAAGVN